jgi:hypothetical protein
MLDTRNRAPYRELAEECRRLAASTPSSQIKNRYSLMAHDYMWLADLKGQAHAGAPATVEENAAWAPGMTGHFPGPWRIAEIPHGFAVDDASGQQLAVFYGLAEPDIARETDFLTLDEARQMAVDFAQLPKRLEQTWARSVVAAPPNDDRVATLETQRSPEAALETGGLPRVAWLPPVARMHLAQMPTAASKSSWFEREEWMSTPSLPRPSNPNRKKFLVAVAIAVAALPAGYFVVRNSARPVEVTAVPQATTDIPPVESLPLRQAQAPAAAGGNGESLVEPEVQAPSLQQTAPSATKPTESGIEAKSPPMLPEKRSFAAGRDASTCFPSASAVRESVPGAWPSWTFKAPGHEGTRCWYAAAQAPAAAGSNGESLVEPEARAPSLQQMAPSATKPTESEVEAKPPPMSPQKRSFAAGGDASTCLSSASAVRESNPGAWPSWTLRAPGHEGTRCWYGSTRGSAHEHR